MSVCKYCGTALDQYDHCGNEAWVCSGDCAFWKGVEELRNEENAKPDAQKAAESENMLNGHLFPVSVKQTHCWTFRADGTHCPGMVKRTLEVQDGPYGHFCSECGYSLRYHSYYSEGRPGDMALKGQIPR